MDECDVVALEENAPWREVSRSGDRTTCESVPSSRRGFASLTYTSVASSMTIFMNSSKPWVKRRERERSHYSRKPKRRGRKCEREEPIAFARDDSMLGVILGRIKWTYNDAPFDSHLDVIVQPYHDLCPL